MILQSSIGGSIYSTDLSQFKKRSNDESLSVY